MTVTTDDMLYQIANFGESRVIRRRMRVSQAVSAFRLFRVVTAGIWFAFHMRYQ